MMLSLIPPGVGPSIKNDDDATTTEDMDQATMNTVSVVSPCDLHPGYQFVANVNGQKILVTVPEGGVKQGQVFDIVVDSAAVSSSSSSLPSNNDCECCGESSGDAPNKKKEASLQLSASTKAGTSTGTDGAAATTGEWKDGVCDCFKYGILHPTVWNAMCCPQVLMKQLSNRLSGTESASSASVAAAAGEEVHKGEGAESSSSSSSSTAGYKRGTTLFLVACVVDFLLIAPILDATTAMARDGAGGTANGGSTTNSNNMMSFGTNCFYALWTLALTSIAIYSVVQLRAAVRARQNIQPGRCGICEDVCCVVCCHGCTLAQLARQTADYDEETAHCCTVDGLAGSERLNPCLFL